ncbi:MAG: DUF1425 domain-containing protein, partial [Patescibacteria group bacterium]
GLGCQSPRPLAVTGHTYTQPTEHRANTNIVAIDLGLSGIPHGDIQIAAQETSWTNDGRLVIVVELENRTRRDLRVQIQTAFKDKNGHFLADQTPYQTVVMPRNQTYRYEATAVDPKAANAHVRVRYARPG